MSLVARSGGLAGLLAATVLVATSAPAAEFFVDARGSDLNDGLSWAAPKATVTSALVVAAVTPEADVVRVAEGIYRERIVVPPDTVLHGGWALGGAERDPLAHPTILDGRYEGCVVTFGPGTDGSALEGFVVRRGTPGVAWPSAGGILLDRTAAVVRECVVEACRFVSGDIPMPAAVMRFEGDALLDRCVIRGNLGIATIAHSYDASADPAMPFMRDCAVLGNELLATLPGTRTPTSPNVMRIDTRATTASSATVERTFVGHNSLSGGPGYQWTRPARARCAGILINSEYCALEVRDSIIVDNDDTGVSLGDLFYGSGSRLVNCLIADNRRIGVRMGCRRDPPDELVNCTIVGNAYPLGSLNPTLAGYDVFGSFARSIVMGGVPFPPPERVHECELEFDGRDSIVEGFFSRRPGMNVLDVDPLLVPGPLHDAYLAQSACGDAVDSPALDGGPELVADVGLDAPYSTCRRGIPDAGPADWGFHASGVGYSLYPDGAIGLPLRVMRGTRPDALVEVAAIDDLPWRDAPGALDDPTLPLVFYSVDIVVNDVRALPDAASRSVRLTW